MNLQFLAPLLVFADKFKRTRKTETQKTADKDKVKYAAFNIEHHKKYDGTFMLFGFDRKLNIPLLLAETNNFGLAQEWATSYDCLPPDVGGYTPCTVCC